MRDRARELFAVACHAANPAHALTRALDQTPLPRPDPGGKYRILAIGKAAVPMTACLLTHLRGVDVSATVVTNEENACVLAGATVLTAGHPVPDENGIKAARAVETVLRDSTPADRVIALISGGGSALLPAPVDGVTLADKAALNQLLLSNGFEITEMNLIRQQISRLKGGGVLRVSPAPVTAYILSDVIGDDLRVIASGPTVAPIGTRAQARAALQSKGIWDQVPPAIRSVLLQDNQAASPVPDAQNFLIGSNRKSLDAILAAAPDARIVTDHLVGDVGAAAAKIVAAGLAVPTNQSACLVFGGETTVALRGTGRGGRNQELALRVALLMAGSARNWAFLSGGTDGRDGPTDAAGGLVDQTTLARIRQNGGDPDARLADNDSYNALAQSDDLLITGATGTNVADVQIFMIAADGT